MLPSKGCEKSLDPKIKVVQIRHILGLDVKSLVHEYILLIFLSYRKTKHVKPKVSRLDTSFTEWILLCIRLLKEQKVKCGYYVNT